MVSLDIEQDRWHHANDLLASDETRVSHLHDKLVDFLKSSVFLEQLTRDAHLKQDVMRIEGLDIHLKLGVINFDLLHALIDHCGLIHVHGV